MEKAPLIDIAGVLKILPHRYPFLLVDKILDLDLDKGYILGQKNVTINEHFFQGHFPVAPIMPGVLIIEALAQVGGILIHQKGYHEKLALLLSLNEVKFRKRVIPGDILFLHAQEVHFSARAGKVDVKAEVEDKVVAQAQIGFALVDASQV